MARLLLSRADKPMDLLFQVFLFTASACIVGLLIRRVSRRSDIEVGQVSDGWLAEQRVRKREWFGLD
jgi:hypothetical protein